MNAEQVVLPNAAVTETNPAARLDYWRFASEQVADHNREQVAPTVIEANHLVAALPGRTASGTALTTRIVGG